MLLKDISALVVDAEPHTRLSLMRLLIREGAHADGAASGMEAFMLCRRRPFDLVILADAGLRHASGDALIRAIRAASGQATIVVAGVSEPLAARARQAGADWVVARPTDWRAVLASVRNRELTRAA